MDAVYKIKKAVGIRARELRLMAALKNAESAAAKIGVSANSVYEVERGENWLSPEMLLKMSAAYGACPASFFPGGEAESITQGTRRRILIEAVESGEVVSASKHNDEIAQERGHITALASQLTEARETLKALKLPAQPHPALVVGPRRELADLAATLNEEEALAVLRWARNYLAGTQAGSERGNPSKGTG